MELTLKLSLKFIAAPNSDEKFRLENIKKGS